MGKGRSGAIGAGSGKPSSARPSQARPARAQFSKDARPHAPPNRPPPHALRQRQAGGGKATGRRFDRPVHTIVKPVPVMMARQRVGNGRVTGKVASWKGKFGWIIPDVPVKHRQADRNGGKIYLGQEDVDQEIEVQGRVSFHLYTDGQGLGAEHCIPVRGGKASAKGSTKGGSKGNQPKKQDRPAAGKEKAKNKEEKPAGGPPDKSSRTVITDVPIEGLVVKWNGEVGWIKPTEPLDDEDRPGKTKDRLYLHKTDLEGEEPLVGAEVLFVPYKDAKGMGAEQCSIMLQGTGELPEEEKKKLTQGLGKKTADEKKPKLSKFGLKQQAKVLGKRRAGERLPKKEKGPSGPDLEREVVVENITGKVISWKGKIGWIKPDEPIDADEADKHSGKIYCHKQDLIGEETLERGASVQFTVFKDAQGLGAQEVILN